MVGGACRLRARHGGGERVEDARGRLLRRPGAWNPTSGGAERRGAPGPGGCGEPNRHQGSFGQPARELDQPPYELGRGGAALPVQANAERHPDRPPPLPRALRLLDPQGRIDHKTRVLTEAQLEDDRHWLDNARRPEELVAQPYERSASILDEDPRGRRADRKRAATAASPPRRPALEAARRGAKAGASSAKVHRRWGPRR